MSNYLLHQRRDGMPVGIFTEQDYYYLPTEKAAQNYGVSVVESRGPDTHWEDWIEQLASKTPSPKAQWDLYDAPIGADLKATLMDARRSMDQNG